MEKMNTIVKCIESETHLVTIQGGQVYYSYTQPKDVPIVSHVIH